MSSFFEKASNYLKPPDDIWPKCIYHFASLPNAISILKDGRIYSRNYLELNGKEFYTNTSESVLSNTKNYIKDYVRFYFRPKTPTQYNVEGLKPNFEKEMNIALLCFFCFKLDILKQYENKCFVSDISLALNKSILKPLSELDSFNYELIYHGGWYDTFNESYIKDYKNAEIVIRDYVDLTNLADIVVRSSADKETLINILHDEGIDSFDDLIIYDNNYSYLFYYNRYFYVYDVEKTNLYIKFIFCNLTSYDIKCYIKYDDELYNEVVLINGALYLRKDYNKYDIQLIVNEELMYYGKYVKQEEIDIF